MTHQSVAAFPSIPVATDAWFRRFKDWSDFLTAAGFPQTSDTGQVDWTTVTAPATATYAPQYEIRRFDDAAQATAPIFMKLMYGYGTVAAWQNPAISWQFGTGSDGAGNLTGQFSTGSTFITPVSHAVATSTRPWLMSSDGSGFAWIGAHGSSIARTFLGLERGRDSAGNVIPQVLFFYSSANVASSSLDLLAPRMTIFDVSLGSAIALLASISALYPKDLSTAFVGLAAGSYYPVGAISYPTRYGVARNRLMIGVSYADFSDETIVDVKRFSTLTATPYRVEIKEGSTIAGQFGIAPSGAASTINDSPAAFAMPAIFWD